MSEVALRFGHLADGSSVIHQNEAAAVNDLYLWPIRATLLGIVAVQIGGNVCDILRVVI